MPSVRLVFGLLAAAIACSAWAARPGLPEEAPWHTDYAKALAEARQTGKPIFAVFA